MVHIVYLSTVLLSSSLWEFIMCESIIRIGGSVCSRLSCWTSSRSFATLAASRPSTRIRRAAAGLSMSCPIDFAITQEVELVVIVCLLLKGDIVGSCHGLGVFAFDVSPRTGVLGLGGGLFRRLTRKTGVRGGVGGAADDGLACTVANRSSTAWKLDRRGLAILLFILLSLFAVEQV